MPEEPYLVKSIFIQLGAAALGTALTGILLGKATFSINGPELVCLTMIGFFFVSIFIIYKGLERHRRNKPQTESVQRLKLDD